MFKKNERKILWPFYGQSLLLSLSKVLMPFYILYFIDIGVSLAAIALIWSFRSVIWFIFEIPTGVIADKYGRKVSVMIWYFGKAIVLFFIPFTSNIWNITLLLWLDAFFQTFFSWSEAALVVDHIKEKSPDLLDRFFLRDGVIFNFWLIFAPLFWGLIVRFWGMSSLRFVVAIWTFLATLFLIQIKEPKILRDADEVENEEWDFNYSTANKLFSHAKKSFAHIRKNKIVMFLFIGLGLYRCIDELTSLAWTPYLQQIGISPEYIWYIFSLIAIIGIILPFGIERLLSRFSKQQIIVSSLFILWIVLSLVGIVSLPILIIVIFVIANTIPDIYSSLESSLSHKYVPSSIRATVFSIKSMVEGVAWIFWWPLAWVLLGIISLKQGIMLGGGLFLVLALIYFFIFKKNGRR